MHLLRRANDRGHANYGWLDTHHTFSFASYYDPDYMGFGALRVINDDRVAAGGGFGTHPHRDMEIVSYVVEGALEHRDSMGTGSVIRPGEVQLMSAGTGVTHSEYNHSKQDPVRFLQIWVIPNQRGLPPTYAQKDFSETRRHALRLVVSPDGRDGSLSVHQDLNLYASVLEEKETVTHELADTRQAWVQVVQGSVRWGDLTLHTGDGLALVDEASVKLEALEESNFLLFDMARS